MKAINLIGKKFGRLTVVSQTGSKRQKRFWKCLCDCGREIETDTSSLTGGNTKSCGCLRSESSIKNIKGQRKRVIDLSGQRFGRLVALERFVPENSSEAWYKCLCDCGNIATVRASSLKNGNTRSCGCLAKEVRAKTGRNSRGRKSSKFEDLIGKRFANLLVLERDSNSKFGATRWKCLCDCGKITFTYSGHLKSGHSKSCGCLGLKHATEAKIKHGATKTRIYSIFHAMHNRCSNPNFASYKWYGQKGIKVCEEWTDFIVFKEWALSHGYKEDLTIDRIDPNKNYEPSNCRWVTQSENSSRAVHKKKT